MRNYKQKALSKKHTCMQKGLIEKRIEIAICKKAWVRNHYMQRGLNDKSYTQKSFGETN